MGIALSNPVRLVMGAIIAALLTGGIYMTYQLGYWKFEAKESEATAVRLADNSLMTENYIASIGAALEIDSKSRGQINEQTTKLLRAVDSIKRKGLDDHLPTELCILLLVAENSSRDEAAAHTKGTDQPCATTPTWRQLTVWAIEMRRAAMLANARLHAIGAIR